MQLDKNTRIEEQSRCSDSNRSSYPTVRSDEMRECKGSVEHHDQHDDP